MECEASSSSPLQPKRVQLKLFVNESTWTERLRFYFIKNQKTSLRIRLFNFILKICSVGLYIFRASYDNPQSTTCCGFCERNWTSGDNPWWEDQYTFSWRPIIWVQRPMAVWIIQVVLALICFIQAVVTIFVNYKGNLCQNLLTLDNFLEIICTVPFIATLCWESLRCMFVPVYLNMWLANRRLNNMINDLQRATQKQKSAMFNQMWVLFATILALLLTCICSVQHLERAGKNRMDMFDATWFVVVTFSTVGYGDIWPTIWPSRVVVIVTIIVALSVLPSQIEDLAHLWSERQKQGGEYSRQRATTEKHVLVCATELRLDAIMEFLNEFYAHPFFQNYFVVLLSPSELEGPLRAFLQIPIWMERVIYLQGSALRENDLLRAKLDAAEACFILTSRQEADRDAADEKTILRAMACKDHAPHCPLYVQILKPASKFHVQFADQVICDEEFKYALLAMNCYIPGLSTMITLLAHTSKGQEGNSHKTEWKRQFGKSAGNEIYHVLAQESKFFGEFIGYRFAHAAQLAHAKCGAALFGMRRDGEIRINPGLSCVIEESDVLFYICVTHEEDAVILNNKNRNPDTESIVKIAAAAAVKAPHEDVKRKTLTKRVSDNESGGLEFKSSPVRVPASFFLKSDDSDCSSKSSSPDHQDGNGVVVGFPPIFPYIGHVTPTLCHILNERKKYCCLRHDRPCEHDRQYDQSENGPIVVCAEFASQSLINVMIPLRAQYRPLKALHPVILVLEHSPEEEFLEAISCFPMVSYMLGNMGSLDSLLLAGIRHAHTVIIIDRVTSVYAEEEYMADSRQLVAAQTIFKLFPTIPTCIELTHTSNMRFNRFIPAQQSPSYIEELRKERQLEKSCSLPYLFRKSFASGHVFSSSMLDTLLYQSMVKNYLMTLLRLLLGLQYSPGSGYLIAHKVTRAEEGRKYSSVFKEHSMRSGGILLGIYRKEVHNKMEDLESEKTALEKAKAHTLTESESDSDLLEPPQSSLKRPRRSSMSVYSVKRSIKSKLQFKSRKQNTLSLRKLQLLRHCRTERENLDSMIQARAERLGLSTEHTPKALKLNEKEKYSFGYVLLNPAADTVLKKGDILYVIQPEARSSSASETSIESPTQGRVKTIEEANEEVMPFADANVKDQNDSEVVGSDGHGRPTISVQTPSPIQPNVSFTNEGLETVIVHNGGSKVHNNNNADDVITAM